jgi:hypothetical protein
MYAQSIRERVSARSLKLDVFPPCVMASDDPPSVLPSIDELREAVNERFGVLPCTWQLEAALTQLGQRDQLTLAPTGSGKTLTFWIPLLFNEDGVTIVITPLTVLGEKNDNKLLEASIAAINLTTTSASDKAFKVLHLYLNFIV